MKKVIKRKIDNIMSCSYEPTLADCKRIYQEYSLNKGEMAAVLSDVFNWLAQEPYSCNYKKGTIYLRAEADRLSALCVHFIYINDEKGIAYEEKMSTDEDDIVEWDLDKYALSLVKESIDEMLLTNQQ